jgi:hypothetical protein
MAFDLEVDDDVQHLRSSRRALIGASASAHLLHMLPTTETRSVTDHLEERDRRPIGSRRPKRRGSRCRMCLGSAADHVRRARSSIGFHLRHRYRRRNVVHQSEAVLRAARSAVRRPCGTGAPKDPDEVRQPLLDVLRARDHIPAHSSSTAGKAAHVAIS